MSWWPWNYQAQLLARLAAIDEKLEQIMSEQSQIDSDVAALTTALGDVATQTATVVSDVSAIQAEIASLQQQVANGQPVNLTALDSLAASAASTTAGLDSAVSSLTGLVPPPAPAGP